MNDAQPGLAPHVIHETTAPRLARQWSQVATRRAARHGRGKWATLAAAVALAFVLGLFVRGRFIAPPPIANTPLWEGSTLESAAGGEIVTLPGGTEVRLGAATRLRISTWSEARVAFALDQGDVTLDVQHVPGRAWEVAAGAFDVRVVGTKFVVRRTLGPEGDKIAVEVIRGKVQVKNRNNPEDVHELSANESWHVDGATAAAAPTASASVAAVETAPLVQPSATSASAEATSAAPAPPGSAAPSAQANVAPAPPSWEQYEKEHRYREAYDALGPDGFAHAVQTASPEKMRKLGDVARASGHPRDAERAYDAARKQGGAGAALAAFELGRIRQDALGNAAGAAEALGAAIALSPGAPFREDAEARRVRALEASGATAACVQARDAYLARYPAGAHTAVVRRRCGGK